MSELTNAKKLLRWIIPMWIGNLILFTICLFMHNYAEPSGLWYSGAFLTLSVTFGMSKLVLSLCFLYGVFEISNGN